MSRVWELDLPSTAKVVLLCLADHANDEGAHVYPSVGLTAAKCSLSERAVQNALRDLREDGILVEVRKGGGRGRTTEYRIDLNGVADAPFFVERVNEQIEKGERRSPKGEPAAPEPSEPPSSEPFASRTIEDLKSRASSALADPDDPERERAPQWNAVEEACVRNLQEFDPIWNSLTWGGLKKLANEFGHEVVTYALQRTWEGRVRPQRPFPYLRGICLSIVNTADVTDDSWHCDCGHRTEEFHRRHVEQIERAS